MPSSLKPGQALHLWRATMLDLVKKKHADLSTRQIAILLTIYMDPPPHTIRGLAQKLGVTKPVITRALDSMGKLDLVARRRDDADRRNVIVTRTVRGSLYLDQLADVISTNAEGIPG